VQVAVGVDEHGASMPQPPLCRTSRYGEDVMYPPNYGR
jgi:hypothetical protein